jgi:hypothetical protein
VSKNATRELTKLVKSRLGYELPTNVPLAKLRAVTLRYVLAGEFRLDLSCDPPASLDGIFKPATKDEESAVRELARLLRGSFPDAYVLLADRVEEELGLNNAKLWPDGTSALSPPPEAALGVPDRPHDNATRQQWHRVVDKCGVPGRTADLSRPLTDR